MRFRNSLRLLMENFKHVYRLMLVKLVLTLVFSALSFAFIWPEITRIWQSAEMQALWENAKTLFSSAITLNSEGMEAAKRAIFGDGGSLSAVGALLSSMTSEIVWALVGCMLIYLVKRFIDTFCHFTAGSAINDKMATYAETKFSTAFVANLGKAAAYSAVYVPLVFLFDVVMVACVGLIIYAFSLFTSLFFGMTAVMLLQALKLTITGHWLPAMTTGNQRLRKALRSENTAEKKQKSKAFSTYLISVYLIVIVNIVAAVCTFGSALLITVPASYFFLICMQYVNYYTTHGKKYFLTYEHIASSPDRGDTEHYFDYISEAEADENENDKNN